jgi:hypothetical protein
MGIRFELLPATWLDGYFKKDEAGRTIFYPWSSWGKGRILLDESAETDIRRFLSIFLSVALFSPIIVGSLFGARCIVVIMLLCMLWYSLRIKALVGGLPFSETKFKKDNYGPRVFRFNKLFSKFTLWLLFTFSMLFFLFGVLGVVRDLGTGARGISNPLIGVYLALFFGAATLMVAYALVTKYRQHEDQRKDELLVKGVRILSFKPESRARKAGMRTGDVIVEYAGIRDLTIEKLLTFIAKTRTELAERRLVFVRDSYEHILSVPSGSLGISGQDTTIQGLSGNLQLSEGKNRQADAATVWAAQAENTSLLRAEAANPPSEALGDLTNYQSESRGSASSDARSGVPDVPIIRSLRNTDRSIASYVWRAWLISFIPGLAIATIVFNALGLQPYKDLTVDKSPTFWVFGVVLLSPWAETLLMWPILAILKEVFRKQLWVALASALIWGYVHSRFAVGWGLAVIWMFFVFSLCFLEWEKKSKSKAIIVTASVHMCQNAVPALIGLIPLISRG